MCARILDGTRVFLKIPTHMHILGRRTDGANNGLRNYITRERIARARAYEDGKQLIFRLLPAEDYYFAVAAIVRNVIYTV